MPTVNSRVKFRTGTYYDYARIANPDPDTVYFVTDEYQRNRIFVGSTEYCFDGVTRSNIFFYPRYPLTEYPDYYELADLIPDSNGEELVSNKDILEGDIVVDSAGRVFRVDGFLEDPDDHTYPYFYVVAYSSPSLNVEVIGNRNGHTYCTTEDYVLVKECAHPQYYPVDGAIITVQFTNEVSAGSSLKVNGYPSYPMYFNNSPIINGIIDAGTSATFIFSNGKYHVISSGAFLTLTTASALFVL